MNNDLISRSELKKAIQNLYDETPDGIVRFGIEKSYDVIDNAPTIEIPIARWDCYCEGQKVGYEKALSERSQGDCKTCRHRDTEDKKCDCGSLERQGCYFPVSDDYYCKYYERGKEE